MVEIHIRLQNTREVYQQNLKVVWRDAVPVETGHASSVQGALRLELSDMLIHACLHLDKHFVTSHVQFTSFNDIFNLLREIEERTKNQEPRIKTEEIADFWQRFEAKCIQYNFADTVFRYLVMVRHYYGAPTSGTATHLLHLKALKNPVDFMRYVKGVVFPGKAFMIEKYGRRTTDDGRQKERRQTTERETTDDRQRTTDGGKEHETRNEKHETKNLQTFKLSNCASGGCGMGTGGRWG